MPTFAKSHFPGTQSTLREADRLYSQGQYRQALHLYHTVANDQESPAARIKRLNCQQALLRKYWRERNPRLLGLLSKDVEPETQHELALAEARLNGDDALKRLVDHADATTAILARCALEPDAEQALHLMRQHAPLRQIADAWLHLLRGDLVRARQDFTLAHPQQPLRAQLGLSLIDMWEKDKSGSSLRKRYPFLPANKKVTKPSEWAQGLNWLRKGDAAAEAQRYDEAIQCWDHARKAAPCTQVEVLKRRFQIARCANQALNPAIELTQLYQALAQSYPEKARSLTEHLALRSSPTATNLDMLPTELCKEIGPVLLRTATIISTLFEPYSEAYFVLPQVVRTLANTQQRAECEGSFARLDAVYNQEDRYLELKWIYYCLHPQPNAMRALLYQRLLLNPEQNVGLLKPYSELLTAAFHSGKPSQRIVLEREVHALRKLFPHHFDLIRFDILLSADQETPDPLAAYSSLLPIPLLRVLELQLAVDKGWNQPKCLRLAPSVADLEGNLQAQARLFGILCHERMVSKRAQLKELFQEIAPSDQLKHQILLEVEQRPDVTIPLTLITNWKEKEGTGLPSFHRAVLEYARGNFDLSLRTLELAQCFFVTGKNPLHQRWLHTCALNCSQNKESSHG